MQVRLPRNSQLLRLLEQLHLQSSLQPRPQLELSPTSPRSPPSLAALVEAASPLSSPVEAVEESSQQPRQEEVELLLEEEQEVEESSLEQLPRTSP